MTDGPAAGSHPLARGRGGGGARERFKRLERADREALVAFLRSL